MLFCFGSAGCGIKTKTPLLRHEGEVAISDIETQTHQETTPKDRGLRLLAAYNILLAAFLFIVAFEVVQLLHEDLVEVVHVWILRFHADPGNPVITEVLVQVTRIAPAVLVEFGVIVGFFGLIHLVQGVGLWLKKVWAEFLSVISTAAFLPLEIIEIFHEFHLVKLVTLGLNLAIVLYLIQRIRKRRHLIHEVHEGSFS